MRPFLLLLVFLFATAAAHAAQPSLRPDERLPGVSLAQGVSEITGVAISPLLGVSALGAWRYLHASDAGRRALPWFCHPLVWGTGLLLSALCFAKDAVGAAAPPLVKKPLDIAELFESKASALLASSAVVPVIVAEMSRYMTDSPADGHVPAVANASMFPMADLPLHWLTLPFAIIGFLTIWLACHTINVLIALSPWGAVDALLKLCKASLLALVTVSAFASPTLGVCVCVAILIVACIVGPWAFRFSLFGTIFGWDFLRYWSRAQRSGVSVETVRGFIARPVAGLATRTYGTIASRGESVVFSYRPFLFLPRRHVPLPAGSYAISKGLLSPALLHGERPQDARVVLLFLPRYRSQEAALAARFGIGDLREGAVARGLKAMQAWLAEICSFARREAELP